MSLCPRPKSSSSKSSPALSLSASRSTAVPEPVPVAVNAMPMALPYSEITSTTRSNQPISRSIDQAIDQSTVEYDRAMWNNR